MNSNATLTSRGDFASLRSALDGVVAQLVEHHNGIVVAMCGRIEKGESSETTKSAISRFLEARKTYGYRPQYYASLRQLLTRLSQAKGDLPVAALSGHLQSWVAAQAWSPSAIVSNLGRLASFLDWCSRQKLIQDNPCDLIDRPMVHRKTPSIFSCEQIRSAFLWTFRHEPRALAFLTLAGVCGIRPEETARLSGDAVHLNRAEVHIDSDVSKVHSRRIVPIPPNAVAWLKLAFRHGARLPFSKSSRKRYLKRLRVALNMEAWPQDILRHTAASYMLAKEKDAGRVAFWLGNSPKVLLRHYHSLVCDEADFYSIRP